MKYSVSILFSLFLIVSLAQGTTSFVGIGVRLQIDSTSLLNTKAAKVTELTPDGSALNSGLKAGDLIMKVDSRNATNLALADVVKLIVGEEGTPVTLEVKRSGVTKTFTIIRKKIALTTTIIPAESSDFCSSLTKILNDAPYHFDHVIDTTVEEEPGNACNLKVPGVERIFIKTFVGRTCYLTFGKYGTDDEANAAGEKVVAQLKACFPDYYYEPFLSGDLKTIQIGIPLENGGYKEAMMELYMYFDKKESLYVVQMSIEDGVPRKFFGIPVGAPDTDFANALRKVYDDIKYEFSNIKGTEHEEGGPFNPAYWYELNFTIPGAGSTYVDAGGLMSMAPDQCIAQFFLGEKELADESYTQFAQIVFEALGSEFVYSYDKPLELMTEVIPDSASDVMLFAIKRERAGESIPVIALINQKQADGRYLIYLDFYKTVY